MTDVKVALEKLDGLIDSIVDNALPEGQTAVLEAAKGRVDDVTIFGYLPKSSEIAKQWNQAVHARRQDLDTVNATLSAVANGIRAVKEVYRDTEQTGTATFDGMVD